MPVTTAQPLPAHVAPPTKTLTVVRVMGEPDESGKHLVTVYYRMERRPADPYRWGTRRMDVARYCYYEARQDRAVHLYNRDWTVKDTPRFDPDAPCG